MFCVKCGTQLPDDAAFCSKCGTKLGTAGTTTQGQTVTVKTTTNPQVGSASADNAPQAIKDAIKNAPADALIGIGSSNHANFSMKRTAAQTRARADISRQINLITKTIITNYTAANEADPSAVLQFMEVITTKVSKSTLTGAVVIAEAEGADGLYWVAVMMPRQNMQNEIAQAQAASKLAVPAMAAFDAQALIDDTFNRLKADGKI